MNAQIHCTDEYTTDSVNLSRATIMEFLHNYHIVYGIKEDNVQRIIDGCLPKDFPLPIAEGRPAINGLDGKVHYTFDDSKEINKTDNWNFREIMRIPSVVKGQKIAEITLPSKGEHGTNIFGTKVPAQPGKPILLKAGKNVMFNEEELSFYAEADGEVSIQKPFIHVHHVYEVNETLSMKIGDLDFVGSIVIHGDVPSGFTVRAAGDVKIDGMVEAATITAGGSIMISEGLAGMQKGKLEAGENIHIGYINQGNVRAGNNLFVENSILHSECVANNQIICQQGNIIGGAISAGKLVEAKDVGNRLHTQTEIVLGNDRTANETEKKLVAQQQELQHSLKKIVAIGKKLKGNKANLTNPKIRITLLRQQHTYQKTKQRLREITLLLQEINANIGNEEEAKLVVRNVLYPSTIVAFGKYKRMIKTNYKNVQLMLEDQEISIQSIYNS